jgi:hypothetical protein
MNDSPPQKSIDCFAWMQLVRLPNVFTAWADVIMGYLITHAVLGPRAVIHFPLLILATTCFYSGGIAMNDLYDLDRDRKERPTRPLPSGRISPHAAKRLIKILFAIGLLSVATLGLLGSTNDSFTSYDFRPLTTGLALLACIWLYDAKLKGNSLVGSLSMGTCRGVNILLGASLGVVATPEGVRLASTVAESTSATSASASTPGLEIGIAVGMTLFVAGITLFARGESQARRPSLLAAGTTIMAAGLLYLAFSPELIPREQLPARFLELESAWRTFWVLAVLGLLYRTSKAIAAPSPEKVQNVVRTAILSIVVLDAVIAFTLHGPPGLFILLLLLPTLILARRFYST